MSNSLKIKARPEGEHAPGQALALRHVGEAFAVLLDIMRDKGAAHATRLRAAATVIERAWGRVRAPAKAVPPVPPTLPQSAFVNVPELSKEEWIAAFGRPGAVAGP